MKTPHPDHDIYLEDLTLAAAEDEQRSAIRHTQNKLYAAENQIYQLEASIVRLTNEATQTLAGIARLTSQLDNESLDRAKYYAEALYYRSLCLRQPPTGNAETLGNADSTNQPSAAPVPS